MYMDAQVRFFLPVEPTPQKNHWSDVAYDLLRSLILADLTPVCLALNVTDLSRNTDNRWFKYRKLFLGHLAPQYVNFVCGVNEPTWTPNLPGIDREQVYDLDRLWTKGVPNIAFIGSSPRELVKIEIEALKKYDKILCPSERDAWDIIDQTGIENVGLCPPNDFRALETAIRSYL